MRAPDSEGEKVPPLSGAHYMIPLRTGVTPHGAASPERPWCVRWGAASQHFPCPLRTAGMLVGPSDQQPLLSSPVLVELK